MNNLSLEYVYSVINPDATECSNKCNVVTEKYEIDEIPEDREVEKHIREIESLPDFVMFNDISIWDMITGVSIKCY